jgi:predicted O-linked N-acetylglucosamine transferase (SPINDLY family)
MQIEKNQTIDPQLIAGIHHAQGLMEAGEFNQAYSSAQELLRRGAHLGQLHYILGKSLFHLQHYDKATVFIQQALRIEPKNPSYLICMGRVLLATENFEDAGKVLEYAFCIDSSLVETHYWWVESYRQRGQSHLIVSHLAQNYSDKPATSLALISALLDLGDRERAFSVLHGALTTHDDYIEYFFQFATVLSEFHQYTKAARILKWLVDRDPDNESLHNSWLQIIWKQGNIKAIRQASLIATDRFPNNPDFNQIRIEALAQSEAVAPQELEQADKRFAIRYCNSRPHPTHPTRYHHDKPRVGYIVREPKLSVLVPVLQAHNQDRFEVYVYSNNEELKASWSGHIRPINSDTEATAKQMLEDEIDILITMSNHSSILDLLSMRPASLQGSWICTTRSLQLPYLDFVIADRNLIPLNERDDWSEHVLELPVWAPCLVSKDLPAITARSTDKPITFGVFQNRSKITHRMMKVWSKILQQIPGSRLKLRDSAFSDPHVNRAMIREAVSAGISSHRIDLIPLTEGGEDNSAFYQEVDICLDCFPFGGGIDIMKTLWMGIPVITHAGDFFASRISATYLRNIGREDWVASSLDEYIESALKVATDQQALKDFQDNCRETLQGSLVTQSQVLTTLLESRLNQIYRAAQSI